MQTLDTLSSQEAIVTFQGVLGFACLHLVAGTLQRSSVTCYSERSSPTMCTLMKTQHNAPRRLNKHFLLPSVCLHDIEGCSNPESFIAPLQITLQQHIQALPQQSCNTFNPTFITIIILMRTTGPLLLALLGVLTLSPSPTEARLTNVVTDWVNATQARVAATGVHNVPASRWYAQTALAIHNAVAAGAGKAPAQALAGKLQL
jgi:hypothetical protein